MDKDARRADQHHEVKDRHLATDSSRRIHLGRTLRDNGEMLTKDGFHRQRWAGKEVSRKTLLDEWERGTQGKDLTRCISGQMLDLWAGLSAG